MSLPRFFVDQPLREGARIALPEAVAHHLVNVLRRTPGDALILFNGRGGEYAATLETSGRREAVVRINELRDASRESPLPVTLAQGVSRGERMEYAIQKAVELGVTDIVPLVTDHCVVRLSEERWQRKQEHWQAVAVAACEQSGRTRVPRVAPVVDLRDWLPACPQSTLKLVLAPQAPSALEHLAAPKAGVALLVGPEGGLSEVELRLADLAGYVALSLGPRTLRTETAGVAALAVLQALWGDLRPMTGGT